MKLQHLFTPWLFFSSFCVFSQKEINNQVSFWIQEHPDVIFIEENNLKNFSSEELSVFSGKYIVFSEEISMQDILKYDPFYFDKAGQVNSTEITEKNGTDPVKEWMAKNPHVKVVTRSQYLAESSDIQREYAEKKCLILAGEKITPEDINNYQY